MTKMMATCASASVLCGSLLLAADFWQTKKASEWSEKEITKIMESSPWVKESYPKMNVDALPGVGGLGGGGIGGGGGRKGGIGGGGGGIGGGGGGIGGGGGGIGGGGVGGPGGDLGGPGGGGPGGPGGMQMPQVRVTFETSMPLADARGRLERPDTYKDLRNEFVVVSVAGMPMMGMGGGRIGAGKDGKKAEPMTPEQQQERQAQLQERVKDATSIAIGKNVYRPEDIRMSRTASGSVMLFAFSRKEIELGGDEKTLQFKTIMGPMELNVKFSLKDMVYQGKVSL